jgi:GT2 family glycosyltransferase
MLHIITLSWNGLDKLSKLKDSLLPCLSNIDWKWTIKDNGSTDNTYSVASQWHPQIEVINYKNNLQSFSAGVNYTVNHTSPEENDFVLLLNNDIIFNDTASINNMIHSFDNSVGVVGAKLLYTGTNKIQHAGVVFHKQTKTPIHFRAKEECNKYDSLDREFQAVTGACLLTKYKYLKNASSKSKMLDESYFWCFEDIDFCLDVKYLQKKKVIYCGNTSIYHEESATLKKNPVQKMFLQQNIKNFLDKWKNIITIDQDHYLDPKHKLL